MSTLAANITVFASCFTAAWVVVGWWMQMGINRAQVELNMMQRDMIVYLLARVENLERQVLPEHELREEHHVH